MDALLTNLVVLLIVILIAGLIFSYKFIKKNPKRIFESRFFSKLFPDMNKKKMREYVKISSFVTLFLALVNFGSLFFNNKLNIWTAILPIVLFVLAVFIWRQSRFAATTILVLYILEIIGRWVLIPDEATHLILINLIFLFIFFRGMQGTVAYQRSLHSAKPEPEVLSSKTSQVKNDPLIQS
jgi:hypothetical protein